MTRYLVSGVRASPFLLSAVAVLSHKLFFPAVDSFHQAIHVWRVLLKIFDLCVYSALFGSPSYCLRWLNSKSSVKRTNGTFVSVAVAARMLHNIVPFYKNC